MAPRHTVDAAGPALSAEMGAMSVHEIDDLQGEVARGRVFQELEQAIREANTLAIGDVAGSVSKEAIMRAAAMVARLRAAYLEAVLRLEAESDTMLDADAISALRGHRQAYEEALLGFGALRHALKRGYFELA